MSIATRDGSLQNAENEQLQSNIIGDISCAERYALGTIFFEIEPLFEVADVETVASLSETLAVTEASVVMLGVSAACLRCTTAGTGIATVGMEAAGAVSEGVLSVFVFHSSFHAARAELGLLSMSPS